jgi:hypothetical protein
VVAGVPDIVGVVTTNDEDTKTVPQVIAGQSPSDLPGDKPVVGRTLYDLIHESESGPKLDKAMSRVAGFVLGSMDVAGAGVERLKDLAKRVHAKLKMKGVEPKAIPERVGVPVLQAVVLEDREEIRELWANLLVGAATGEDVDDFYIGLVKQLNPNAAHTLHVAGLAYMAAGPYPNPHNSPACRGWRDRVDPTEHPQLADMIPDKVQRVLSLDRLEALGLLRRTADQPNRRMLSTTAFHLLRILGEITVPPSSSEQGPEPPLTATANAPTQQGGRG